jgi:hypothetical protein
MDARLAQISPTAINSLMQSRTVMNFMTTSCPRSIRLAMVTAFARQQ